MHCRSRAATIARGIILVSFILLAKREIVRCRHHRFRGRGRFRPRYSKLGRRRRYHHLAPKGCTDSWTNGTLCGNGQGAACVATANTSFVTNNKKHIQGVHQPYSSTDLRSATFADEVTGFFQWLGIALLCMIPILLFITWSEERDRKKQFLIAERMSRLTDVEEEKARSLQKKFCSKMCPICLDPLFEVNPNKNTTRTDISDLPNIISIGTEKQNQEIKHVDNLGIPSVGTDGQPIKLLRCGHTFHTTCWKLWAESGHGDPTKCPVCRQDVVRCKIDGSTTQNNTNNNAREVDGSDREEVSRIVSDNTTNQEQHEGFSFFTRVW